MRIREEEKGRKAGRREGEGGWKKRVRGGGGTGMSLPGTSNIIFGHGLSSR